MVEREITSRFGVRLLDDLVHVGSLAARILVDAAQVGVLEFQVIVDGHTVVLGPVDERLGHRLPPGRLFTNDAELVPLETPQQRHDRLGHL